MGHYTPLILGTAKSLGALPYIYTNEILQLFIYFCGRGIPTTQCMYLNETLESYFGTGRFKMEEEQKEEEGDEQMSILSFLLFFAC